MAFLDRTLNGIYALCGALAAGAIVLIALLVATSVISRLLGIYVGGLTEGSGYAMAAAPEDVPWQRVLAKARKGFGKISIGDSLTAGIQRELLEAEGVEFTASGQVDLARFGVEAWPG